MNKYGNSIQKQQDDIIVLDEAFDNDTFNQAKVKNLEAKITNLEQSNSALKSQAEKLNLEKIGLKQTILEQQQKLNAQKKFLGKVIQRMDYATLFSYVLFERKLALLVPLQGESI